MKALEYKNVVIDEAVKTKLQARNTDPSTVQLHPLLDSVVRELAPLKPTWKFTCSGIVGGDGTYSLADVVVTEGQETLGHIKREYARRDYKLCVINDRINSKRERGRGYTTEDPKKAIAKIKREFGRMTVSERMSKAMEAASNYAYHAVSRHQQKVAEHRRTVHDAAREYVLGDGYATFMEYVQTHMLPSKRDTILNAASSLEEVTAEMSVLENIRGQLGSNKSALIIRDFEQYIVRIGDKVELHDDNTLPVALRGKLGLLKLVDKEHFVSNAGCRVTEEVFVVVLDEEADDTNNVSEGE